MKSFASLSVKIIKTLGYHGRGYNQSHGPYSRRPVLGRTEGLLHEYAHAACLEETTGEFPGCREGLIADAIQKLTKEKADENELQALAVEKLVLGVLGIQVSTLTLGEWASSGMETKSLVRHPYACRRRIDELVARDPLVLRVAEDILSDISGMA